jgi:hypothetical protein
VQIRYYIDPTTGLPHIYEHGVSEPEIEAVLRNPQQDFRGREIPECYRSNRRGTISESNLRSSRRPRLRLRCHGARARDESETGPPPKTKKETMSAQKYPPGWNESRVRRVIEYYESQSDEEAAAEIKAGSESTMMRVPSALVPAIRRFIARLKPAIKSKPRAHRIAKK